MILVAFFPTSEYNEEKYYLIFFPDGKIEIYDINQMLIFLNNET